MSSLTPPSRIVLWMQRVLIRLARTPLRGLLTLGYRAIARGAVLYLARGERDAAAFVRGGPGTEDFWPGLSDLDLALVVSGEPGSPGLAAQRTRNRWRRLQATVPPAGLLLDWPRVYEHAELDDLAGASSFDHGLGGSGRAAPHTAAYFGERASLDRIRMLERPGLYAPNSDWSRVSGTDRRPREAHRDPQARRIAAWLELLYWWRWTAPFCVEPIMPRTADLCVKLIAEPARIWLWLAHGERTSSRVDALERALRLLPEEADGLRFALELRGMLPDAPAAPLRDALPPALRLSGRIAELLRRQVSEAGVTEVRLIGDRRPDGPLPLADWRALACPEAPQEAFLPLPGDPRDPAAIAAAATAHPDGPYPALRGEGVMLLPAAELRRSRLRAIKCPVVDPVVFAVLDGADCADFPNVSGWSAADTARRAVAEHRVRLASSAASEGDAQGLLLTAARAGLFLDSIERGEPELCLTPSAVAERLADTSASTSADDLGATRQAVFSLPAYR